MIWVMQQSDTAGHRPFHDRLEPGPESFLREGFRMRPDRARLECGFLRLEIHDRLFQGICEIDYYNQSIAISYRYSPRQSHSTRI